MTWWPERTYAVDDATATAQRTAYLQSAPERPQIVLPAFVSAQSQQARGAAVYAKSGCQHCHSIRDVGGDRGPDLSSVGRTMKKAQIRRQIMEGGGQMPAFGDILSKADVEDLLSYLHSCRDKKSK